MGIKTYKVIFSGIKNAKSLTFKHVPSSKRIFIPKEFISSIKSLSETNDKIISIQIISEVIIQGWINNPPQYNYYLVLLVIENDKKMEGFLIGNLKKKKGDVLIGIWPFSKNIKMINSDFINKEFDKILSNNNSYEKITIIHS